MANWARTLIDQMGRGPLRRARSAVHFDLGGGQKVAQCVGKPIHWWSNADGWGEIDTALRYDAARDEWRGTGTPAVIKPDGTVLIDGDQGGWYQRMNRVALYRPSTRQVIGVRTLPAFATDGERRVREHGVWRHELLNIEDGLREQLILLDRPTGLSAQANDWLMIETLVPVDLGADDEDVTEFTRAGFRFHMPAAWDSAGSVAPIRRIAFRDGAQPRLLTGVPVSWLAGATYPVTIDPDFAGGTADGHIYGDHASIYATARSTGVFASTNSNVLYVGQRKSGAAYAVYRSFLRFDTSSIGASNTVTQDNLAMATEDGIYASTPFTIEVGQANWSGYIPLTSYTDQAYDLALSAARDGDWLHSSVIYDDWESTTRRLGGNLTPSWVNTTGYTHLALRSSRDASGTTPTGNEYVRLYSADEPNAARRPVLTVAYEAGGSNGSLVGAVATASALSPAATLSAQRAASLAAQAATADALSPAATLGGGSRLAASLATAAADVPAASLRAGSALLAAAALASAIAPAAGLYAGSRLAADVASASALSPSASLSAGGIPTTSVQFNAADGGFSLVSDLLDYNQPFTLALWVYVITPTNWQTIFRVDGPGSGYLWVGYQGSAQRFSVWGANDSGAEVQADASMPSYAGQNGVWRYVAIVRTSTNSLKIVLDASETVTLPNLDVSGRSAPNAFSIGYPDGALIGSRVAHVKAWMAALDNSQLTVERDSPAPVHTNDLYAYWPLVSHADPADSSGNERHLTGYGSLSTATGPSLSQQSAFLSAQTATASASSTAAILSAVASASLIAQAAAASALSPSASLRSGASLVGQVAGASALAPSAVLVAGSRLSAALATATASSPAVSLLSGASLLASLAQASGSSPAATLAGVGVATLLAALASASAQSPGALLLSSSRLLAGLATASAGSPAATLSAVGVGTLLASLAQASAQSLAADLRAGAVLLGSLAGASAGSPLATLVGGARLVAGITGASALSPVAALVATSGAALWAEPALASATSPTAALRADSQLFASLAAASTSAPAAILLGGAGATLLAGIAGASASSPSAVLLSGSVLAAVLMTAGAESPPAVLVSVGGYAILAAGVAEAWATAPEALLFVLYLLPRYTLMVALGRLTLPTFADQRERLATYSGRIRARTEG
jgi:hypothetical protein